MKSPNPVGRIGPLRWQDWYRACEAAVLIQRWAGSAQCALLVVSGFEEPGFFERDFQREALGKLGGQNTIVIPEGFETIGQIEAALNRVRENNAQLVVVSSLSHFPRVWWLTRNEKNVSHRVIFGIPRPQELMTDLILDVVFPIVDVLGWRQWFLEKTAVRRENGKL